MATKNRVQLKTYIRFQLSQMSARNEQHLWENAAYELARQTISPNILPATGPVQAGGDQGRDFESYRTYLNKVLSRRAWTGRGGEDVLAFACTLDKKLPSKIKSDLKSIFGGGEKPVAVYYYAEPDLPVAKRHELQAYCQETYGAKLEIFDGQAVADQLADSATFWIAEQFFSVPAEMFPAVEGDADYAALRDRWLDGARKPDSYADFVEVKRGLRRSSTSDDHLKDLGGWLELMRHLATAEPIPPLQRKALYEILVGQIKGRKVLDPEMATVGNFFDTLPDEPTAEALEDAAVAVSFCTSASRMGAFHVASDVLQGWRDKVMAAIGKALATAGRTSAVRYLLLLSRGQILMLEVFAQGEVAKLAPVIADWRVALAIAKDNPFCDIAHFTDIIELLTPFGGGDPDFQDFVDQFDALIAVRDGAAAAGERSRDRAMALYDAGKRLAAIDQLQRTKEEWFAAETMVGSVLAMLLLAETYRELNLPWAARLYASAAQMVALQAGDEGSKRQVAKAGFQIAATFFAAGEALSYAAALGSAVALHMTLSPDPGDLERHSYLVDTFTHMARVRALVAGLEPALVAELDKVLETWPLTPSDLAKVTQLSSGVTYSADDVRRLLAEDVGYGLTNDLGEEAQLGWRALGVSWAIITAAKDRLLAEQLAAILQIIQADLGEVELLIIPSNVELRLAPHGGPYPRIQREPDNAKTIWTVGLPKAFEEEGDDQVTIALTVVLTVLEQASALSSTELRQIIDRRMKRGLMNRAFWVGPSHVLLGHARRQADTGLDLSAATAEHPFFPDPLEAPELAWKDGPAPTYSKAKAEEYLANRYERMTPFGLAHVPQIMAKPDTAEAIKALHSEGLKDWRILSILFNIALQHEAEAVQGPLQGGGREAALAFMKVGMQALEAGKLNNFDPNIFTPEIIAIQRKIQITAVAETWKLAIPGPTPDFAALDRLLDTRFAQAVDDIDHEDIFGW